MYTNRLENRSTLLLFAAATAIAALANGASQAEETFRIGYLVDLNGPTSYATGAGAAEAAKMAVEDFGGSVLGRKIEILVADHQNKADIGAGIAREWFDTKNVNAIFDVSQSTLAFAVRDLAVSRKRIVGFTSAMSTDLTGSRCSPYTFSWGWDNFSSSRAVTDAIYKEGGKRWYYLAADYTFGKQLEADSAAELKKLGGEILGSSYAPLGTTDFSSNLLQASTSKPDVLAFANSTNDLVNALKQSLEFGLTARKAVFVFSAPDADIIGLKNIQDAQYVDQFYWDMNDEARSFAKRFTQRMGKDTPPTGQQVNGYGVVMHYLKAVRAAGTADADAVAKAMRDMPVNDFFTTNARIREDGKVMRDMYLLETKKVDESKSRWDLFKVVHTIPAGAAFMPAEQSACPALKGK
nr:ABC transporter substrate-binding protein [Bradyrhizobium elkanii]